MGSGGGSGYLAVMGLAGLDPLIMKPTALALNVLVTSISTWQFVKAGHFSGRHFWPIAIFSIPAAFLGGRINLSSTVYKIAVGLVLLYAGWRMWRSAGGAPVSRSTKSDAKRSRLWQPPRTLLMNMSVGAGIGLLSGMLGIGGGIFLGPILILTGWLETRDALGVTAAFVLLNSLAGLLGRISVMPSLPIALWLWLPAVGLGGYLGAKLAQGRLDVRLLRRLLAAVLLIGGIRMIIG